jgi:hypothetical protein
VAWVLIGVGALLVIATLLLAFTLYGEIAAVLGAACLAGGIWMTARKPPDRDGNTAR